MQGFTEDKLLDLCSCKHIHDGYSEWKYWTSEIYAFGKYIREYGYYPPFLPLHIYTDHGVGNFISEPSPHELNSTSYCQFYHSIDKVQRWKDFSSKLCFPLYSPFVFYRRKNNINLSDSAKGTLAFPAHSTPNIDDNSNIEDYIEQLKNLPQEFQPVSVCLHMHDIDKEQYKIFLKHGIPVFTAGHISDYRFVKRFYNILKNFKYTTSNIIGSYTYYSLEMNIPFFIYGNEPQYINKSDNNAEKGEYKLNNFENYNNICKMFEGLHNKITDEQKKLIEHDLGIYSGISRIEMANILYTAYFKHGNIFNDILYTLVKYIKKPRHLFMQIKYELFDF